MFTAFQEALRLSDQKHAMLTSDVHDQLANFEFLTNSLSKRPTRIAEVVPTKPTHVGACNAAVVGMGGVWIPPLPTSTNQHCATPPLVWREPFPEHLQRRLVTWENPTGTINNSDLELAGVIALQDILAQVTSVRKLTLATLSDNTLAVYWKKRGSIFKSSPAAYLLRLFALHRRPYRYLTKISHIPGDTNGMADTAFLNYFNIIYPQVKSW